MKRIMLLAVITGALMVPATAGASGRDRRWWRRRLRCGQRRQPGHFRTRDVALGVSRASRAVRRTSLGDRLGPSGRTTGLV